MSFRQIALCAFFGGLLLSPAAQAAKIEQTETYDVPAGASRTFQTTYMTMDTKCRPVKAPRMSLQAPPRYGKVRFVAARANAVYGEGAMHHCNGRAGPSTAIVYTAPAAAVEDAFIVRVRFSDGEVRYAPFVIRVGQ